MCSERSQKSFVICSTQNRIKIKIEDEKRISKLLPQVSFIELFSESTTSREIS
jgi:hypothetical protein